MSKKEHYVNNREFTKEVIEWRKKCDEAVANGLEPLPITDYMGECFTKIARRYALSPTWSKLRHSHLDDMVNEAALTCIKYAHNFDPEKSNNAFAYFTQYCHNVFCQIHNKEKKIAEFKFELLKEQDETLEQRDHKNINLFDEENEDFLKQVEYDEQREQDMLNEDDANFDPIDDSEDVEDDIDFDYDDNEMDDEEFFS